MKKLNIGAGKSYIPGFVNIDISENAELQLDLSTEKLPFEDNSVELVFSYHTLEHIPNYIFALTEIHRVLKHGGVLLLGVPYVTSTKHNLVNPYHLHHFNEYSFDFFGALKGSAIEENEVAFKKVFHKFHYKGIFNLLPPPFSTWCRNHLFNVVKKIDFGLIAVKNEKDFGEMPANYSKKELKSLFKSTNKSRIPYIKNSQKPLSFIQKVMKVLRLWWKGEM
ncbi:MAG: methyltransferase domain-containing protein [Flavobacteriales bacterium]|nr:methyltransferase domain-containing protein [Flavobacteriales bacterium]NNK80540.1 methyltransferase domain-containing protein [Flavobacteriales bacterium]